MVTHWPVDSRSARRLVSGVFERRAMIAVMNDAFADERGRKRYSYAHPMFWAPYALIGDAGRVQSGQPPSPTTTYGAQNSGCA